MLSNAKRAPLPDAVEPELATLVGEPPAGSDWLHELKLDGYRILCRIDRGEAKLFTRRANDWTDAFSTIATECAALACRSALIDGEAVVLDAGGRSSFQTLQNSFGGEPKNLFYFAFDLLHLDGWDLRPAALFERKEMLENLIAPIGGPVVRYSAHVVGRGDEFFREACRIRAEGIVSKRIAAPYRSGRTKDWLKVKCLARQEFVIVGFTDPAGARRGIGALLVGAHDESGALVFCGKVGTGYTGEMLLRLRAMLEPLERSTAAVRHPLRGAEARRVHWVEPRLVAEVSFTEWTDDGVIRHPSFRGLRADKTPDEVKIESLQTPS